MGLVERVGVAELESTSEAIAETLAATRSSQPNIYQNTNIGDLANPCGIHAGVKSKQPPALYVNSMIVFLWIGLTGMTAKVGIHVICGVVPAGFSRMVAVLAVIGASAAVAIFLWFRSRTPRVGDPDQRLPDGFSEAARIRVIGPARWVRAVLANVSPDAAFEPVIQRLVLGHAYDIAAEKGAKPTTNWFTKRSPEGNWTTGGWDWQAIVIGMTVAGCAYLGLRGVMGSWPRLDVFLIWALMGGALLVLSLAKPAFVRIAPGVLDIQECGWLGIGPLRTTRYDLRRARIYIDLKQGVARIEDDSRADRKAVCIRPAAVLPARSAAWWACWKAVLEGAVTGVETAWLPEGELVG
jgi:hypothetical protein